MGSPSSTEHALTPTVIASTWLRIAPRLHGAMFSCDSARDIRLALLGPFGVPAASLGDGQVLASLPAATPAAPLTAGVCPDPVLHSCSWACPLDSGLEPALAPAALPLVRLVLPLLSSHFEPGSAAIVFLVEVPPLCAQQWPKWGGRGSILMPQQVETQVTLLIMPVECRCGKPLSINGTSAKRLSRDKHEIIQATMQVSSCACPDDQLFHYQDFIFRGRGAAILPHATLLLCSRCTSDYDSQPHRHSVTGRA